MTVGELIAIRKAAGLSQTRMAEGMGLSMRAYQDIEGRDADEAILARHELALEAATLRLAVERSNPMLTTARVRDSALRLVEMIRGA